MNIFYQRGLALFVGISAVVSLYFVNRSLDIIGFLVPIFSYVAILILFDIFLFKPDSSFIILHVITYISFVMLLTIISFDLIHYLLIILAGITSTIFLLSKFDISKVVFYDQKPVRRFLGTTWAFNVYAFSTLSFGLILFFPNIYFWLVATLLSFFCSLASFFVWKMHLRFRFSQSLFWLFMVTFIMIEVIWVLHLLPFGYLLMGLIVTWLWYIMQLLIRFHLGPKGIIWSRQRWFLASNLVLIILLFIYFVRWV
jgi:hypothetical protein